MLFLDISKKSGSICFIKVPTGSETPGYGNNVFQLVPSIHRSKISTVRWLNNQNLVLMSVF